jgi:hypothetical protein
MHPYISQAIAAERVADAMRVAEASRRARDARQAVAGMSQPHQALQSRQSHRARLTFRRQPCAAGVTVSAPQCR